ncbi:MAG TPA: hypothetical protein VG708_07610 [Mycobacteriales bacterium]|nr:hypothetical protein [Mycobacteriales bacterium]
MIRTRGRRGTAAVALALAGTTSMATLVAAAPASAASSHSAPAFYSGQAQSNALGLNLKLPVKLGPLPNPLGVDLIHLQGATLHDPLHLVGNTVAQATSTASLITGSLVDTLSNVLHINLNRTASVSLNGASHQENSLLSIPAKPLADLSVGDLVADLTKLTDATSSAATGVVANIGDLNDLLGASTVSSITNLLDQLDLTGKVQSVVDKILSTVQGLTGSNPTVSSAVNSLTSTVNAILDHVNQLVSHLGTTSLVKISVHDTHQSVAPSGNGVQALSQLGLVDVDVLGGLLTISGFHNSATAFANGLPGGAHTDVSATKPLLKINALNALCAQVDTNGLSLCNVDGMGLPSSITDPVNKLLKTLSGLLTTITSKILGDVPLISETQGSQHAAADGTTASAVAPAYNISVGHLLTVTLGDGVAATASASQKPANHKPVTLSHLATPPSPKAPLPNTGMNLGLLGLGALLLLGAAAVLRRRFAR